MQLVQSHNPDRKFIPFTNNIRTYQFELFLIIFFCRYPRVPIFYFSATKVFFRRRTISTKDHHLRPRRLRRSTATRKTSSSGQHSLPGVELAVAVCLPMSTPLIGAEGFLRLGVLSPEDNLPKDDHLRPTTASPEYGRPQNILLRPAFPPRS